ncbi:MDN1 [Symbiodinium microadriaticum]|nr:MDN1 [Symbiodinium microadriaticum]CAE7582271.1 MDN1 [Symbiodinium sp. KB8]
MMQSGEGGEARELISLPSRSQEQVPTTPYVVAPGEEVLSYNAYIGKLRNRVVALSVLTVGCFVVSVVVQLFFGFLSWQSLQQKLEYLAQVEAIPELSTFLNVAPQLLLTSAVPAVINALVIGGFFALCGLCGARANNQCCACCYCCCNMCCCVLTVATLLGSAVFLNFMYASSDAVEIWFAKCDPSICYPAGPETDPRMTVDCLAPAVWDVYLPQIRGPHLPRECPPMYLVCKGGDFDEPSSSEERYLKEEDQQLGSVRPSPVQPPAGVQRWRQLREDLENRASEEQEEGDAGDVGETEEAETSAAEAQTGAEDVHDGVSDRVEQEAEAAAEAYEAGQRQALAEVGEDEPAEETQDEEAEKEDPERGPEQEEGISAPSDGRDDPADSEDPGTGDPERDIGTGTAEPVLDMETGDEASLATEREEATSPPDAEDPAGNEGSEPADGTGGAVGEGPDPDEPDGPPSPDDDADDDPVPQGDVLLQDERDDKDGDSTSTEASDGAGDAAAQGEDEAEDGGTVEDTQDADGSSRPADGENDADTSGEDGESAAGTGDEFEPPDEEGYDENNLQRLASQSQALAKVLSLPMPDDPTSACSPSKINSLYDVARREAPDIFNACTNLVVVRICCLLPTLVIFALGSVWGYELYGKLSQGYLVPFVPAESTQVQMTYMSEPLMVQSNPQGP